METMKSLWFTADRTLEVRDIPKPEARPGYYLIKVVMTGICGSDFEGYMGRTGRRIPPMIMGHEWSGIIEKAPEGGKYRPGTKVTAFPKEFCGHCEFCKEGKENVCQAGVSMGAMRRNGSMCGYVTLEEKYLFPFENLSFESAAMTEPFAVAYRSVYKVSDEELRKARYVLVIGAGTIGLLLVSVLKHRGAENIIVSDNSDFRLGVAKKCGASFTINPSKTVLSEELDRITSGRMVDISFEAVGVSATASDAVNSLRLGGTSIWVGLAQKIISIDMQKVVNAEITIRGNYVYSYQEFGKALALLETGGIDLTPLQTHHYPLEKGAEAFKALEDNRDGRMIKVFLT